MFLTQEISLMLDGGRTALEVLNFLLPDCGILFSKHLKHLYASSCPNNLQRATHLIPTAYGVSAITESVTNEETETHLKKHAQDWSSTLR